MANLQGVLGDEFADFDVQQEAEAADKFGVIETPGWYPWRVVDSDIAQSDSGAIMIVLEMQLVGSHEMAGSVATERFYMRGPSIKAKRIGKGRYAKLCRALGFSGKGPADTVELHDKVALAYTTYVPAEGNYRAKNEFSDYKRATPEDIEAGAKAAAADAAVDSSIPF